MGGCWSNIEVGHSGSGGALLYTSIDGVDRLGRDRSHVHHVHQSPVVTGRMFVSHVPR